ncbi:MAG TPA: ATP-binding protein [Roseiflexaceae bacterium]|nr:ATP-binding protein [Roseiflexaceae bacterium]
MRTIARLPDWAQDIARRHSYLWSISVVAIVTALLWFAQYYVHVENVALFYLVAVLLCAVTAGRAPALLGAVLSFLAFKFFFVEPRFTFTIDNISDPWQLVSFIAAALIAGAITLYAREQAATARKQAREMAILYQVSQSISTELDFDRIAPVIVETTEQLIGCPACRLLLSQDDGGFEVVAARGNWPPYYENVDARLRAGEQIIGLLRVAVVPELPMLAPNQQRLLETLANQAALALERSRLAQAAARAEALAESDRLKSSLLSAVSHDLRTPLAAITAAADELMADDVQWTRPAILDFAQIIKSEATQLYHLVLNMLDLTRIEAGVLRPQRGWYNVAEIIYRVLQRLAPSLEGRPIDLHVPDDLPLIPVDYIQLEQILWNVLQNALTYAPPASALSIVARQQSGSVILTIGDCGPGIPAEERTRVFEKFYRLSRTHQAGQPGAGLGLAICKGLVEAHGGEIAIGDREGGGALVTIRLPLDADRADKEHALWPHPI